MATRVFFLYRYQILPVDTQPSLLYNLKDLIAKKNQYFRDAVLSLKISGKDEEKRRYKYEVGRYIGESIMLITSRQKSVKVIREDHTPTDVDSFPFAYIIFDNDKDRQIIAVQESAELHARTIVSKLEKTLQKSLAKNHLMVKITPIYKESNFWIFVEENEGKISSLSFNLITPNMANISSRLSEDLKKTAKTTGTIETNLKFNASKTGSLNLQQDNSELDGLVNYAAQGGGEIGIKLKDSKLAFRSNDFQMTLEIGEGELKGDLSSLVKLMRDTTDDGDDRQVHGNAGCSVDFNASSPLVEK